MQYKLPFLLAAFSLTTSFVGAQTASTFDDIILPGPESDLASTYTAGQTFSFESGNVRYFGEHTTWGGYSLFNASNITDTTETTFLNDRSVVTGIGEDGSENYGIAFVPLDFTSYETVPIGASLINGAAGGMVHGAYFTNTTYAYHYMAEPDFKAGTHYLTLTIRGYENGNPKPDSVNFVLADFRDSLEVLVKEWTWVDLTTLGTVDSLTFDLSSSDTGSFGMNVPAYFAMDRLVTLETNPCTPVAGLNAEQISHDGAVVSWTRDAVEDSLQGVRYFYAVDQSPTPEPEQTGSGAPTGNYTTADSITLHGLSPNTTYYFHIQKACMVEGQVFAPYWDTLSFTTGTTGIATLKGQAELKVHPNPANGLVKVQSSEPLNLRIIDLNGRTLLKKNEAIKLDIRSLSPGMYFLEAIHPQSKAKRISRFTKL